ncbi:MAG TPA: LysR family transcriptional regulator, partial [Devosia sp.]|nr:LysR family transcriptional regulator [Devosia sp.]
LLALDVLLEERSVTRAAGRLNLSQPAMSAALSRLRDFFGDALLVPQGRRMIPTSEALALHPDLKAVLGNIEELIARSTKFDPATSDRTFRICASDYLVTVLFPRLVPELQHLAPAVRLDIVPPSQEAQIALERGEIDLLLTPEEHCVPGHPAELLFVEKHVVAGWDANPLLATALPADRFFEAGHVAVRVGQIYRASFAETHLESMGRSRRIELTVSSFTNVPHLLVGTHRLAVMHRLLAQAVAQGMPITWQDLPFPFPVMRQMIQRNRTTREDVGLAWLVRQLRTAVDQIG